MILIPWSSLPDFHSVCSVCSVVDHRADFFTTEYSDHTEKEKRSSIVLIPWSSLPGLHSVCSVCSVVRLLRLGLGRHPSRIGYAQFVVRIAGHDKQQVAQTVQENHDVRDIAHTSVVSEPDDFTFDTTADGAC